jgi:chromosome segregation ATPase
MSKITDFIARKSDKSPSPSDADAEPARPAPPPESTAEAASRLGAENEALRNVVAEAARKVEDLDNLKLAFGRIIDPLQKTLVALEQERSNNVSIVTLLNESRASADTFRTELQQKERLAASLSATNERLQQDLEQARQSISALETTRIELINEIANKNTEIADLQSRLSAESIARQALADEHRIITDQAQSASKRLTTVEADLVAARQKLALAEDEKRSLQNSLDQTVSEVSRLSRKLAETNSALSMAQTKLANSEATLAETDTERRRLASALDEATERHRSESSAQTMRLDALQSRAATAEKLLAEARGNLAARADELREFDRKMTDATIGRNAAEKKLAQLEGMQQTQERQIKDLEQARAALVERNTGLSKSLRTRETDLARSEEKGQSLGDMIVRLEDDIQGIKARNDKRVEELSAQLERERMDRAVAEGALEATRKDNARLTRENARLEALLRQPDESHVAAAKRGKSTVEPIIKS